MRSHCFIWEFMNCCTCNKFLLLDDQRVFWTGNLPIQMSFLFTQELDFCIWILQTLSSFNEHFIWHSSLLRRSWRCWIQKSPLFQCNQEWWSKVSSADELASCFDLLQRKVACLSLKNLKWPSTICYSRMKQSVITG